MLVQPKNNFNQTCSYKNLSGHVFCALAVAVIISAIHARYLYRDARSFSLQVSMSSSASDHAQLYYDTGKGLSESESARSPIAGDNQFHIYYLSLPLATIHNLRFDPLTTRGIVSIRSISVVNGFGRSLSSIDLLALRPANQIKTFDFKNNTLTVTVEAGAHDPQILIPLHSPLKLDTSQYFTVLPFVGRLFGGFFVFFLSACFLIWMLRRRGILAGFLDQPVMTSRGWIGENKLFVSAILCLLAFRVFFVLTYPLETCSDQGVYYRMMRSGTSTLVHATGYPFFMHFFSAWLPTKTDVLVLQHLIDFGIQLALMVLLKKRFGLVAAVAAGLCYGLELRSINWVSRSTPEWLQGAFFALAFVGAMEACLAERPVRKISLYLLSAWAFAWTVLMKFLTVVMLPVYLILFISERREWKGKWLCFAAMGIIFFAQIVIFIYFYHHPSTGTKALTSITGWTLHRKISHFLPEGHHLSESGPWSKRYCILVSEMPERTSEINIRELFGHVDSVPHSVRKPYRERNRELSAKSEAELQAIINTKQNLKGLDYYFPAYFYLGLSETDSLLERVFFETVARYPKEYLLHVLNGIKESFFIETSYYIAVIGNPHSDHPFQLVKNDIIQNLPWGYARYNASSSIGCMYDEPVFLKAGLQFFSSWGEYVNIPAIVKWLLLLLGAGLAAMGYKKDKGFGPDILYLSMGMMVLFLLIVLSNAIFGFRDKEFEACQHLLCLLVGISVSSMASFWKLKRVERASR